MSVWVIIISLLPKSSAWHIVHAQEILAELLDYCVLVDTVSGFFLDILCLCIIRCRWCLFQTLLPIRKGEEIPMSPCWHF